ncbi:hypothetical protein CE91St43_21070 [Oscillospiraceae bacterium]|nr:hypothetical protein CE91St43_21070 [Oscillospiraceae bacterium]
MTDRELNEFNRRLNKIKELGIYVPKEMTPESKIRGVYGFFVKLDVNNTCFYIGKSNNIFLRIFGNTSHLNDYLRDIRRTDVHKKIEKYLNDGHEIEIKILQKIDYIGDSFEKDANRLALAELQELVKYQDMGGCQEQLSEAVKERYERIEWERIFKPFKI